jgi:macrolide transport system ATP-binding/permease protein
MRGLRAALARVSGLWRRRRRDQAIADELESHLQMHVDDNLRAGMSPEAARRHAMLKLGGVAAATRAYRERSSVPFVEHLAQDLRFAARQLAKSPGFTLTAVLTLALGIGASVAIFGFVDAALIRPLPYPDPNRLVEVTETTPQLARANLSWPDYLDWKRLNTSFTGFDIHQGRSYTLRTAGGAEMVMGVRVSAGFFRTLGVTPVLGRDFLPGEDEPGRPDTTILTWAAWQRRFGGRTDVLGQTIALNNAPHTIVGVLPQSFQFAPRGRGELFVPFAAVGECDRRRSCHALFGVARLKPTVSLDAAAAEMRGIARQLETQYPDSNRDQGASVLPLTDVIVGEVRPVLLVLLGGAGLLLLIACVNVTSLLLVRSEGRRRELAVRSALGASNGRLLRQFVTEGLVLVALSTAIGLLAGNGAMRVLTSLAPVDMRAGMPFLQQLGLGGHAIMFASLVGVIATLLFSLAPAVRLSFSEMREGMAEGSRGSAGNAWRRLGFKLVVLELATAMVLLVGAGLLGKSLYRLLSVDLGFDTERLASLYVAAPITAYPNEARQVALERLVHARVSALPGIESAGATDLLPVSLNGNTDWIRIVGHPWTGRHIEANRRGVSPTWFQTIRARLLRGRHFTDADTAAAPRVVIINETMARLHFPGEDPIGRTIGDRELTPASIRQIVGIVADIREGALDSEIWPAIYAPIAQSSETRFAVVVRTGPDPHAVLPSVSAAIRAIDPELVTLAEAVMTDRIGDSPVAYLRRSAAWLAGGFAGLALLLGVVGLYGVIAYSVSQRTREIGVRLAMGASRGSVYQLVLREASGLAAMGLIVGLVCSVAVATFMRKLLFGTPPWDVSTLAAVAVVLLASALLASYAPARRAASVDPIEALRAE